jgi:hypothetical protein
MLREVIVGLLVAAFGSPQSTPVIDLTLVVPRNRVREPATASSSGGSVGGSWVTTQQRGPIVMSILSVEPVRVQEPYVVFEVQVQNTGSDEIKFPVDPNLADFEPESVTTAYSYTAARITLFIELKEGNIFLPGVSLYGSEYVPGSFRTLDGGESVRIRARTRVKAVPSGLRIPTRPSVRAALLMQGHFVAQQSGGLHEDSKQILPQVTSSNAVAFSLDP